MTRHRLSLPVSVVKQYTLDVIRRKMPPILPRIGGQHTTPFPKHRSRLKSFYEYRPRSLSRDRRGRLRGGVVRLVAILFDFTFVRSIFASEYSARGGHCYDPASLFVLLVFAFVAGYEYLSDFVTDLHDPDRGHQYRVFAGINDEHIPQEADFTNFIQRCGPLFAVVFHTVVEIVRQAGFISGRALTTDGMLVPTWSRYRGCNYFDTAICPLLAVPENLVAQVQACIDELGAGLSSHNPVQGGYVQIECPRWAEVVAAHPYLWDKKPKTVLLFHPQLYFPLRGMPRPDAPVALSLDGARDSTSNYGHLRSKGGLPIVDYNPRQENRSPQSLQTRGYDERGWPYADCGCLKPPLKPIRPIVSTAMPGCLKHHRLWPHVWQYSFCL